MCGTSKTSELQTTTALVGKFLWSKVTVIYTKRATFFVLLKLSRYLCDAKKCFPERTPRHEPNSGKFHDDIDTHRFLWKWIEKFCLLFHSLANYFVIGYFAKIAILVNNFLCSRMQFVELGWVSSCIFRPILGHFLHMLSAFLAQILCEVFIEPSSTMCF